MGSLSLHDETVGSNELGSHHSEGSETLSDDVTLLEAKKGESKNESQHREKELRRRRRNETNLNVSIVVLASPNESSVSLDSLSNHIVDQPVLVPDTGLLELSSVIGLVDGLEDVLELSVVLLEDGAVER